MLKKFLIILAAFSIIACSGREVDISKKQERGGIVYIVNEQKPFSGVITGKYGNGQIKIKETFKDGKYNGQQNNRRNKHTGNSHNCLGYN